MFHMPKNYGFPFTIQLNWRTISITEIESECILTPGQHIVEDSAGTSHTVNVVARTEPCDLWIEFGLQDQSWNYDKSTSTINIELFSSSERTLISELEPLEWYIESDVQMAFKADDSWHPSTWVVLYLETSTVKTMSFRDQYIDKTVVSFSDAEPSRLHCEAYRTHVCGKNNLPPAGGDIGPLIITQV